MKKTLKVLGWTVLVLVLVVIAAVLALPLWISPVARGSANAVAPTVLGTGFNLGKFEFNQYNGTLTVGDMQIANPTNITDGNAIELNHFHADVAVKTLLSNKIHAEEVTLDGLTVNTTATLSNLLQIKRNVLGPDPEEPPQGLDSLKTEEQLAAEEAERAAKAKEIEAEKKAEKHFVIDKLLIKDVKINYGLMPIAIPTIELDSIGTDSEDGIAASDLLVLVIKAIGSAAMAVVGSIGNGVQAIGSAALGAVGDAAGLVAGTNAVDAVTGAVGDTAGAAAGAVGDAAGAAVDAAGAAAGAAVDAVKGIFGN